MTRSDDQRIADILEYADKIASAVKRGHEAFIADEFIEPAIERFIEVLGEAARQLSEECKAHYPEVNWAEIIGIRTRLAHIYHRIDIENIWGAATSDVPSLAKNLRSEQLSAMEELEDIEAFDNAISSDEPFISWEEVKKEIIDKE